MSTRKTAGYLPLRPREVRNSAIPKDIFWLNNNIAEVDATQESSARARLRYDFLP